MKLNWADGLACLLTAPAALPQAQAFIRQYPNLLIGFGDINLDAPNVLEQVDRFHASGLRGFGDIEYTRRNYDIRAYWPVYERAHPEIL